jgi:ectoine hydroxylase-related dioxygenase (phytanoyl-CoA dioxygenase family)
MTALDTHALNDSFTWTSPAGPYRIVSDAQARAYSEVGAFVLEGAFDRATLDAIMAEIDPVEARVEAELRTLEGGKLFIARADAITFTTHLVATSPVLRDLVSSAPLTDLCADLIGPDVRLYWDQAVYKKHDADATFPWHQDNGYAFVEPQQYLTIWLALTDATEENGCPQVVPGLHRRGTLRHRFVDPLGWECLTDPDGVVAAPVPAGGAVVFSSLTPHLTGPNVTDAVRKAYIVQYAPEGAEKLEGDWMVGPPTGRARQDDPTRQPLVVSGGRPVPVEAGS